MNDRRGQSKIQLEIGEICKLFGTAKVVKSGIVSILTFARIAVIRPQGENKCKQKCVFEGSEIPKTIYMIISFLPYWHTFHSLRTAYNKILSWLSNICLFVYFCNDNAVKITTNKDPCLLFQGPRIKISGAPIETIACRFLPPFLSVG